MIKLAMKMKCDAFLSREQFHDDEPGQCDEITDVVFQFLGLNGTIPTLSTSDWPDGWHTEQQPDGCEDRHFCPRHKDGDEPFVKEGV